MKVCYICHSLNPRTGIGSLVSSIVDQLRRIHPGLEISTITSEDLLTFKDKIKLLANFKWVVREARKTDLIHAFDAWPYGLVAILAGWLSHKPVLLTAVGTGSVQKLDRFPYSFLLKLIYRRSTKVTAISHYVKRLIKEKVSNVSVEVITPGIDPVGRTSLRSGNPVQGKNYILSVGTFKKRKGYDVSLKVFKSLLTWYPDLSYVIVGRRDERNPYLKKLELFIRESGLGERVIILSDLNGEQLRAVYRDARLFILLSRNDRRDIEGFGQVFLEAAAAGVPVIGGRGSGADDAVDDGKNGYLVDPEKEEEIVAKTRAILNGVELRNKLSDGGLAFARKMDWVNKIQEYNKLYAQIQS